MTATLPLPPPTRYQISEDLRSEPFSGSIFKAQPGEWEREELLLKVLGARGWGRIHHFRNYYEPGWGDGKGRCMSPRALEAFYQFLSGVKAFPGGTPSVFLTDEGGLEIVWGEKTQSVQVEFTAQGIEFFQEATGNEGQAPLHDAKQLAESLSRD